MRRGVATVAPHLILGIACQFMIPIPYATSVQASSLGFFIHIVSPIDRIGYYYYFIN